MSEFLSKLSSYNIFNYLVPGVVFAILGDVITDYGIIQKDIVVGLFLYYFIGLVVSRIGSLVVEPLLRKVGFLETVPYFDFIKASKEDEKIETLSEANNSYRTFVATFASLVLLKFSEFLGEKFPPIGEGIGFILIFILFSIFLLSYRKQNSYVVKRVTHAIHLSQGDE
ncbi:MAG: hypothetical protein R3E57_07070 [Porticoccaceae bacterium]